MNRAALVVLLASLLIVAASTGAFAYNVTITVKGPDGAPLAGAELFIYAQDKTFNATTNENGVVTVALDNGTYGLLAKGGKFVIYTVFTVTGDTSITVDASQMHTANLTSTPISVEVELRSGSVRNPAKVATNTTLYSDVTLNVTFPKEVTKLPFKYTLSELSVNGAKVDGNSAVLDMTANDYNVVAKYTKTFGVVLQPWMLGAILVVVAIALIVAMKAGAKTAKQVLMERSSRFVKRRW